MKTSNIQLATECIESVVYLLPPKQRFHVAVNFALTFLQKQCLAVLEFASLEHASRKGQCDLLDFYWQHKIVLGPLLYSQKSVDMTGTIKMLEWWEHKFSEYFSCSIAAVNVASIHGRVGILAWWWKKGKYIQHFKWQAMDLAQICRNGHVAVLQWWNDTTKDAFQEQSAYSRHALLRGETASIALYAATESGQGDVLKWWFKKHGRLIIEYLHGDPRWIMAIATASCNGHAAVLHCWREYEGTYLFRYFRNKDTLIRSECISAMTTVIRNRDSLVLEWWKTNYHLFSQCIDDIMLDASTCIDDVSLQWCKQQLGENKS